MKRSAVVLLVLLAGCGTGNGVRGNMQVVSPLGLEPPPVYSLLGFRQELNLTSAQIAALDSIAEAVRRENAPLVQQLREQTPARAQQSGLVVVDSAAVPLLDELRENNRRAMGAVGDVLDEEQRNTACRLFDQARPVRNARGQQASAGERRRTMRTERADSLMVGGRGWSWCVAAAAAADTLPTR